MSTGFGNGNREQRANLARANSVRGAVAGAQFASRTGSQAVQGGEGARHASGRADSAARVLLALVLGVSVFASALFIALELNHECSGDACPVCHVLHAAEGVVAQAGVSASAAAAQAHVPLALLLAVCAVCVCRRATTLVGLKVRLDV